MWKFSQQIYSQRTFLEVRRADVNEFYLYTMTDIRQKKDKLPMVILPNNFKVLAILIDTLIQQKLSAITLSILIIIFT